MTDHPEDRCHRCDGPNISWYTPGGAWDPVMRPDGEAGKWSEIICPLCFDELTGGLTWALVPMKDDGERWTSADEREAIIAKAREDGAAEVRARVEGVLAEVDGWTPYESRDTGLTFLEESVRDLVADLRAALEPPRDAADRRVTASEGALGVVGRSEDGEGRR